MEIREAETLHLEMEPPIADNAEILRGALRPESRRKNPIVSAESVLFFPNSLSYFERIRT